MRKLFAGTHVGKEGWRISVRGCGDGCGGNGRGEIVRLGRAGGVGRGAGKGIRRGMRNGGKGCGTPYRKWHWVKREVIWGLGVWIGARVCIWAGAGVRVEMGACWGKCLGIGYVLGMCWQGLRNISQIV